jgi:hypothetical protein
MSQEPTDKGGRQNPAGKVTHDKRGNAVWTWVSETGKHLADSTSVLLKKLEVPELDLEDAPPKKEQSVDKPKSTSLAGGAGGFDPYSSRGQGSRTTPATRPPPRVAAPSPSPSPSPSTKNTGATRLPMSAVPAPKRSFWKGLFGGR